MKHLYAIALLSLLVSCQKEEKKAPIDRAKTDWAFYGLKGDVESISTKSWKAENASLDKGATRHETGGHDSDLVFDENGKLVSEKLWKSATSPFSETTFDGREHIIQHLQYTNDKPGTKTEYSWNKKGENVTITKRNNDNTEMGREEMKYIKGKLTQKVTYNAHNNPIDKRIYTYNKEGNLAGEAIYLRSEYVQFKTNYSYDEQNRVIVEAKSNKDGTVQSKTTFTYTGDKIASKITVDEKGAEQYSEHFNYDAKGNLISLVAYEKATDTRTVEKYTYDAANNRTSWAAETNGKEEARAEYKYDSSNNLISSTTTNLLAKSTDSRQYTYEYDSNGNWTKKIATLQGKPAFIVERTIKYFN